MTKKELLRIAWDAYSVETVPATFEDLFTKDLFTKQEELRVDIDSLLGDGLLAFILREIWETADEEDPDIMIESAVVTMRRAMEDVERVFHAFQDRSK